MKKYADYTNEMLCAAIQAGDEYAKAVLIDRNRRWVGKLAESFHKMLGMNVFATSAAIDDLIQAGNMAMLRAAERYKPNKAPAFLAYAKKIVLNAMRTEAKREYAESPLHLLKSGKVRAVVRLDDSYDEDTDSSLSECIPDERELTPEAWYERKENARPLWDALKALNPHDREFIMLRYGLGNRNGNTESRKGILPLTEAATLAHISLSRAKRIEADALDFLKKHIEEQHAQKEAPPAEWFQEALCAAEKLMNNLRHQAEQSVLRVHDIPFFACSSKHPEAVEGTAELTVATAVLNTSEQLKRCAYVPTWIISRESRDDLTIHIRFLAREEHAAEATLRLHVDTVVRDYVASDNLKNTPDLTEWLWCLACELWMTDETEAEAHDAMYARRAVVRDICDAVLEHHRHLGG